MSGYSVRLRLGSIVRTREGVLYNVLRPSGSSIGWYPASSTVVVALLATPAWSPAPDVYWLPRFRQATAEAIADGTVKP